MLQNGGQVISEEYKWLDIRGGQSVGRHFHALVNLTGGLIDIRPDFLQMAQNSGQQRCDFGGGRRRRNLSIILQGGTTDTGTDVAVEMDVGFGSDSFGGKLAWRFGEPNELNLIEIALSS